MTMPDSSDAAPRSLAQDVLLTARYYLGSRAGLVVVAATALGLGAYLNWSWLVAAGIAPLLLGVAPCAAMCALGLCMGGMKRKQEAPSNSPANNASPAKAVSKADDTHGTGCC